MLTRKTIIAGNWKMNGSNYENTTLINGIISGMDGISSNVIVCPPSIYLSQIINLTANSNLAVGAQNINLNQKGAFTGEISVAMIKDIGANYVIAGHSERRSLYGETNKIVANKVKVIIESGLIPILCIGEELSERESGKTNEVLAEQMQAVFNVIDIENFKNIIIAYEPIWAIGTGITATPKQAQDTHQFIRSLLSNLDNQVAQQINILYGGSMNPSNAKDLLKCADIDGGLIGGASLKADDFLTICKAG